MGVPQAERVATIQPFPLKEFKETLDGMGVWVGEGVGGCGRVWVVWMGGCGRVWVVWMGGCGRVWVGKHVTIS